MWWGSMAKLPNMLSLWNLLVLSLALNVSLILRMVSEGQERYIGSSCFKNQGDGHVFHETSLTISSSLSSNFANSSRANHPQGNERVINLDQTGSGSISGSVLATGLGGWLFYIIAYVFSDCAVLCFFLLQFSGKTRTSHGFNFGISQVF